MVAHLALSGSLVTNVVLAVSLACTGYYVVELRRQLANEKSAAKTCAAKMVFLERRIFKLRRVLSTKRDQIAQYKHEAHCARLRECHMQDRVERLRSALSVKTRQMENLSGVYQQELKRSDILAAKLEKATWEWTFHESQHGYYKTEVENLRTEIKVRDAEASLERKREVKRSFFESLLAHFASAWTGPKDSIVKYQTALTTDQFLLIAHGAAEVAKAKDIIETRHPAELNMYSGEAVAA